MYRWVGCCGGQWGKEWRGEESVVRQGDGGSNVLSWEIEGAYRCR